MGIWFDTLEWKTGIFVHSFASCPKVPRQKKESVLPCGLLTAPAWPTPFPAYAASTTAAPGIVRRASSATPVPVVNETFSLLLSGLRLSFKGSSFFGSFGQGSTGIQSMLL